MSLCDSGQKKMCQEFGMKRYKVTYSFVCVNIHRHAWEAVKKKKGTDNARTLFASL